MQNCYILDEIAGDFNLQTQRGSIVNTLRSKHSLIMLVVFAIMSLTVTEAWAISSPEPLSGGRFFNLKGTRAAETQSADYSEYDYSTTSSLSRTESDSFERQYYGRGLKLGAVRVMPSLGYTGEYDSNIYLTERDAKGDYISRLLGGLDAYLPMKDGKYVVAAGVRSRSEWFAKNSNENHTDWTYQARADLNFNAFNVAVSNEFRDTTARSDDELTQRVKRYENILRGLITVPFGRFFSETEVNDQIIHYRESQLEQFDLNAFSIYPRLGVNVGARTQALVEYGFYHANYRNLDDRDADAHQGQFGLRGFLGNANLLSYQIWGGWQFRNYDNGNLNDFNSFIGHGELVYQPTSLTQYSLRALRRPEESITAGQSYFTRNEVSLRMRRQLARSWFAHIQAGTGFSHYSNDRIDFSWEPGVGVEYLLPGNRLALFTEYRFSARESDRANNDYNRHIANFGIRAQA